MIEELSPRSLGGVPVARKGRGGDQDPPAAQGPDRGFDQLRCPVSAQDLVFLHLHTDGEGMPQLPALLVRVFHQLLPELPQLPVYIFRDPQRI